MSDLLAGALGSLITLGAAGAIRLLAARSELRSNNLEVSSIDGDLERWVVDDHSQLKLRLSNVRSTLAGRGMLESGDYAFEFNRAKQEAVHRYRDRELLAGRERERIRLAENTFHWLWRRLDGPLPVLTTPDKANRLIDHVWLAEPRYVGDPPPIADDPRERSLDALLRDDDQVELFR